MNFCNAFKAVTVAVGPTEKEEAKTNTIKNTIQKRKSTFFSELTIIHGFVAPKLFKLQPLEN